MAATKYRVRPGYEQDRYIGSLPDFRGGIVHVNKIIGEMTQEELRAWKLFCPTTAFVDIIEGEPEEVISKQDNEPGKALPKRPRKASKKSATDEEE